MAGLVEGGVTRWVGKVQRVWDRMSGSTGDKYGPHLVASHA